jgi:hypothetical protein
MTTCGRTNGRGKILVTTRQFLPNRAKLTYRPAIARVSLAAGCDAARSFAGLGPNPAGGINPGSFPCPVNAFHTENPATAHNRAMPAAAHSPHSPAPSMVTGSRPDVPACRQPTRTSASSTARSSASRTVAAVQTFSPNTAAPIAATGTISAHRPNRRSTRLSTRQARIMNIHMTTIVDLVSGCAPWSCT